MVSLDVGRKRQGVLVLLLLVPVIAIIIATIQNWNALTSRGAPVNEQVVTFNDTDFVLVLTKPYMAIPILNILVAKEATLFADIYPKIVMDMQSVKLSSNTSSSLNFNSQMQHTHFNGTHISSSQQTLRSDNSTSPLYYRTQVSAVHPLQVTKENQTYSIDLVYFTKDQTTGHQNIVIKNMPFEWTIETWDLGNFNYFWIIFLGVVLSRISHHLMPSDKDTTNYADDKPKTNDETTTTSMKKGLPQIDLLWVPFSAIITLLIFSTFREQVNPTTDVIANVALAFAFGFGFDKVLTIGRGSKV